jgi:phosphoribosylformylglycinamidine synthase
VARNDELLFSESQSRFVVTVSPPAKAAFERMLKGNVCAEAGRVTAEETLRISGIDGKPMIDEDIHELKAAWQKPLNF